MTDYAGRMIVAVLAIWLFLMRMHYTGMVRRPKYPHAPYPWWERALVTFTSLWLIPVALYVFTGWIDSFNLGLPDWLHKLGAAIMSAGVLLHWWAHATLGRNWSAYLEIRPHQVLVTHGPFRWVRHPMYLAVFIIGIGLALLTANGLIAGVYFLPVVILYVVRIRTEEEVLLEHFGDEYRCYAARTGRLLPFILKRRP